MGVAAGFDSGFFVGGATDVAWFELAFNTDGLLG
jgi:hypothetical protein